MTKVFHDVVDLQSAKIIADNFDDFALDSWDEKECATELKMLNNLIDNTDKQSGLCKVAYRVGKGKSTGRFYCKNGVGIQKHSRMIRNTIPLHPIKILILLIVSQLC